VIGALGATGLFNQSVLFSPNFLPFFHFPTQLLYRVIFSPHNPR
jgi:hypothetical protein